MPIAKESCLWAMGIDCDFIYIKCNGVLQYRIACNYWVFFFFLAVTKTTHYPQQRSYLLELSSQQTIARNV
jgi:hypothetical protein